MRLFLRARPLTGVVVVGALLSLLILLAGDLPVPSLSARQYAAATAFRTAPALAAVAALALLASGMHEWENLASRSLMWCRLAIGAGAVALPLGLMIPAGLASTTPRPALVVVQGVLACCGLGMLASPWLVYSGQAAVAFCYAMISLNATWAASGPLGDVLTVGVPPSRDRLVFAGVVAAAGVVVQSRRSNRLS